MAEKSIIAWTENTFNPWIGCTKVSPGCAHCYAEVLVKGRMNRPGLWGSQGRREVTGDRNWKKPLAWNRQAEREGRRIRVFCGSLCDWLEDTPVANEARPRLWALIKATPLLDWQLLTKRPERLANNLPPDWGEGWPNVWLGTSIENDDYVWRADHLRVIPAAVRFISYEPALGPLDGLDLTGIDWLIYGGESGPNFRPEDKQWARDIRARCQASGTAFFHKQSVGFRTETGIELDGQIVREYPASRRIPLTTLF